jgi:anti-sigma-K factor RskA
MQEHQPTPGSSEPQPEPTVPSPDPIPEPTVQTPSEPEATPPTPGGGLNPKLIAAIAAAVIVVGGAAAGAYFLTRPKPQPAPVTVPVEETPSPEPTESLKPGQDVAPLKPIEGYQGVGEASRSVTPGRFVLTVSATLPDPPAGKFYEVYLVRKTPAGQFAAGKLTKEAEKWVFTLDQARDASAYAEVLISLEAKDDKQPEIRVLSGTF